MRARQNHIKNLSVIFGIPIEKMRRIYSGLLLTEKRGHELAEQYCNGEITAEHWEDNAELIEKSLKDKLGKKIPILLNGDPRGYFLKIPDEYVRKNKLKIYTDWGGYGILCPESL